jgi:hypothetical protein
MLLFEAYFGIMSIVWFVIQVILISFIGALFVKMLPWNRKISLRETIQKSALSLVAFLWFFTFLFLGFILYQNTYPGKLSDIRLSHSGQTVVFLEMSHIAHPNFYTQKQQTIQDLANDGYVFLIEWVRWWTPENEKKFSEALGFEFTRSLYQTIADIAGFTAQNNDTLFASVHSWSRISVDISIDQMIEILRPGTWSTEVAPPVDIEKELAQLDQINTQEKRFLSFITRWILNLAIKQPLFLDESQMLSISPDLMNVILHERNKGIIDYIIAHPHQKIAVVYGALHFEWVLAGLRKADPAWKIESFRSFTPYAP